MKLSQSVKIQQALEKMKINNYEDVIMHLPRTYLDFHLTEENHLLDKQKVVIEGKMVSSPVLAKHGNLTIVRFSFISSQNHLYTIVAYNRPYLLKQLKLGEFMTIIGVYDLERRQLNLTQLVKGELKEEDKMKPVYSLPEDIENYQMIRLVKKAFTQKVDIQEVVPEDLKSKYRLLDKKEALFKVHFPHCREDITQGYRTLKYEECLLFTLKTLWIRRQNKAYVFNRKKLIPVEKINDLVRMLPYKLTNDQKQAIREIIFDMNSDTLMYRLMQGDVGSGKTVVAALALYGNYLRNDQGAFMAPTDALARQHYQTFLELFSKSGVKIALLVGALSNKEKQAIKEQLQNGEIDIVIGTHALFSEDVIYHSLGLAIIDEQHRFGVNQRSLLASKGDRADLLLMSATPIPRTLALTAYGDLDVTTIQSFPFKKRQVVTNLISSDAEVLPIKIEEALNNQKQIYIIAPLIEENDGHALSVEELYDRYNNEYPGLVSLLHGKMSVEEKENALEAFKSGKTPILISTTVVEVGIDVKTANLMIIYNANQFGLASLHQLRGRIGRDGEKAYCFLIYDGEEEEEKEKLRVLEKTDDGFVVAEEDLKRRGPGEFIGYRQSGLPNFHYVNFISDFKIIETAKKDAQMILDDENNHLYANVLKALKEALLINNSDLV